MRITTYKKGGNSLNPLIKLSIFLITLSLFVMPVSATGITNGDFETGDFYGWNITAGTTPVHVPDLVNTGGNRGLYTARLYTDAQNKYAAIRQDVDDFALYDNVSFDAAGYGHGYQLIVVVYSAEGANTIWSTNTIGEETTPWGTNIIDLSYTGSGYIEFRGYSPHVFGYDYYDNIFYNGNITQTGLPTTHSSIQWDEPSYYTDEIATVSYFLHDDDWLDTSLGYGYTFYMHHKDSLDSEYTTIRLTSEFGAKEVLFDEGDSYYTAYVSKHWADRPDSFLFPEIVLDTENVNVYQRDRIGTLNLNTTLTTTGTEFNITYKYEYVATSPSITIKRLVDGVWSDDSLAWIGLDNYAALTEYTIQESIDQEGKYLIELRDGATVLRGRVIEIVFVGLPPTQNITSSFISTDKEVYLFGSTIFINFAIDNINYSSTAVFMDVYNTDKNILSYHLPVYSQFDTHYMHLTGTKNIDTNWGFFIIIPPKFYSGNNIIRLSKYDITTGVYISDIVTKAITIDTVTTGGYGLTLSEYEIIEGEDIIINYVVPSASTLKIVRAATQEVIKTMEINTSDSFRFTFNKWGVYDIELHSLNYLETTVSVIVNDAEDTTGGDPSTPDITLQTNTTNLLNSPYLIGLFIMAVFLAIGSTKGIGGMIVTGSMGLGIVCYMGIFPWVLLVIEVLVVAALFSKGLIDLSGD